jgi:hypothetical protein
MDPALSAFVSTDFERVERLADLPDDVRRAIHLDGVPMAEAGGDWNPGCILDERPGRRFIFAGKSPRLWFIYAEHGGRSHYQRVVTLRRNPAGILAEEGSWTLSLVVATIQELKTSVRATSSRMGELLDPTAKPLPPKAFEAIDEKLLLGQIVQQLGPPQSRRGSGLCILVWRVTDGREFAVGTAGCGSAELPIYAKIR